MINPGFRPALGCEIISSRHFPDDAQGQYLIANVIGFNGIGRFKVKDDGAGYAVEKLTPLLESTDKNFRPGDPQIGPDGALYFIDWHNPLIGHMQYSQRDPNRDHVHGRVYRVTAKNRPLLKTPSIAGKPIPFVLDQLKAFEARTAYRARIELRARETKDVLPAVKKWVAGLDRKDPNYERHLCEALFVQQGHHAVDEVLLKQVLAAKDFNARAAASHVVAEERRYLTNALDLIRPMVADAHPRVRVEALRALSFFRTTEAAELALLAASDRSDYYVDYTLQSTISALEPVWKPALVAGTFAKNNSAGRDYLDTLNQGGKPSTQVQNSFKTLVSPNAKPADRATATKEVAKASGNAKSGAAVFNRICIACHKVGNEGAELGPEMNKLATRLKREEIIESIIDPNAKIDPKFLATNITTHDGDELSGLVASEDEQTLTLASGSGQKQILKKSNIKARETLKISSMPEGLVQTMALQEFLDLVEFLAGQK